MKKLLALLLLALSGCGIACHYEYRTNHGEMPLPVRGIKVDVCERVVCTSINRLPDPGTQSEACQ